MLRFRGVQAQCRVVKQPRATDMSSAISFVSDSASLQHTAILPRYKVLNHRTDRQKLIKANLRPFWTAIQGSERQSGSKKPTLPTGSSVRRGLLRPFGNSLPCHLGPTDVAADEEVLLPEALRLTNDVEGTKRNSEAESAVGCARRPRVPVESHTIIGPVPQDLKRFEPVHSRLM